MSSLNKTKITYECNKCNKIFSDKTKYTNHMNRKTSCVYIKLTEINELVGEDRTFGGNDLFIDLIPKSCWFTNVRTSIKGSSWDKLRKFIYERVNYKCECCNLDTKNSSIKLEAHERWSYDTERKTQKLMRIIALCEKCHLVTHFGRAKIIGYENEAREHLINVRKFNTEEVKEHIQNAYKIWRERNKFNWTLDLELIEKNNIELVKKYSDIDRNEISNKHIEKCKNEPKPPMKIIRLNIGPQSDNYDENGDTLNNDEDCCDYLQSGYGKPSKYVEYFECDNCNILFIITSSIGRDADGDYNYSQGFTYNCKKCNANLHRKAHKYENECLIYDNK